MIFFRKLLMYVSAVFLFFFSILSLVLCLTKDSNRWIREEINDVFFIVYNDLTIRIIVLTIATLFLLLCLGVLFSAIKFGRRDKTFKVESPYGEVMISVGAVEDYINMVKTEIAGVKDIRPKVFLRKGKLKIYAKVSIWSDSNIADMVLNVQNAIKVYLENILGEEKVGEIRVFVSKILHREDGIKGNTRGFEYPDKGC